MTMEAKAESDLQSFCVKQIKLVQHLGFFLGFFRFLGCFF